MKRFLKFFAAIVASAMTLFSCGEEEIEQILAKVAFDKASYEIGAEGGELKVKVLVTVDWTAAIAAATSLDIIDGITLPADKGKGSSEPIEIVVKFAANEGFDRTVKLSITGGGVSGSCTITQKGSAVREMEKVTVAQFLEKPEDASIYYELKGVIKSITNTDYSNFVMKDIDGDAEILIYGLAYESDIANQKVQLLVNEGIQEGDIITIASTRGSYNGTPEGMNSYYISHEKSATPMIKLDKETYEASATGEEFVLNVTSNIVTWTLSADVDWLSFDPSTGNASTAVKVTVAAGEGGTGTITLSADGLDPVTCVVTRADLTVLTIAEFLAKPDDENKAYQIGGIITNIVMDKNDDTKPNKYGNFYIKDHTGEAYIYGLLPEKGGASGQDVITEKGLKIGDFVSLAAPKSSYNDAPQGKNAWLLAAYPALSLKAFSELEDDATKSVFYTVSGTVSSIVMDKNDETKPNKYGNIYIKDAEGFELYIYGVLDWDGKTANFESLGVKVGDVITGYAYKTSYNGTIEAVNLQPVIIESGEPVVEEKWDYTPGADFTNDANLWKAIFAGDGELISGNIAAFPAAPVAITTVEALSKKESTYKFHFNGATEGEWSNCNFITPAEDYALKLVAGKKYTFKIVLGADKDLPRAFVKVNKNDPAVDGLENGWVWETTKAVVANTPVEISDVIVPGSDCPNISFTLDFGGNPEDVNIYVKDITIIPVPEVDGGIPDYDPITGFEL
ncbi:MAG: BACON domain-containing protein [Bacteroidales bacterium]|nr:BACON domain-containing protein [Bacteroidales bacterium]